MTKKIKTILLNLVLVAGIVTSAGVVYGNSQHDEGGQPTVSGSQSAYVSTISSDDLSSNSAVITDDSRPSNNGGGCDGNCAACGKCAPIQNR